jgi:sulfate permease, SulP family
VSIQAAVGLGVLLAALHYLDQSSKEISLVELVERPDGRLEERAPPGRLPVGKATVLDVYGDLLYAGARTLEGLLPAPQDAGRPAVILRLRGRKSIEATLIEVLSAYAARLAAVGGRLYLSGVAEDAREEILRTHRLRLEGPVRSFPATPVLGESTRRALVAAETWLAEADPSPEADRSRG